MIINYNNDSNNKKIIMIIVHILIIRIRIIQMITVTMITKCPLLTVILHFALESFKPGLLLLIQ